MHCFTKESEDRKRDRKGLPGSSETVEYIEQAAGNYIMNAFAHCGEGRQYENFSGKERRKSGFGVYNDSEPLTDEEKRKIWEKYYQGEEQAGAQRTRTSYCKDCDHDAGRRIWCGE